LSRVSEFFRLERTQPTLDFVDVDVTNDLRVFVDPHALRLLRSEWGNECATLVQNFFETVMQAIREGEDGLARQLLSSLHEPNETHLGLSAGESRGRAMADGLANDVWDALSSSEAAESGLLEDLEDAVLLVDGISSDIISDVTTNIIRQSLIAYTQTVCQWYSIPLIDDVDSGPMWDPESKEWFNDFEPMPVAASGKLLLVPKSIVRRRVDYDAEEYYRDFILENLRDQELSSPNSELVKLLKNGERRVTNKSLKEKYGRGKRVNLSETRKDPSLLSRYRRAKERAPTPPLSHETLAFAEGSAQPDWDALLSNVTSLPTGRDSSDAYERAVEALLSAIFYPCLSNPEFQRRIHSGRKRIDITYTNIAEAGFFRWLTINYRAPYIFVECKNYEEDPGNPELDQLSGRFSPDRGQVGILVCRTIAVIERMAQRCHDTSRDQRGFILFLDDADLAALVRMRSADRDQLIFPLLRERFNGLIN
jgi:hypothetical protein